MTLRNLDREQFQHIIQDNVRPSDAIDSFEHLVERTKQRESIEEALNSRGRHVFIYGDRGAGKTSLAQTVAFEQNPSTSEPILVACGAKTTFTTIVEDIATQLLQRSRQQSKETSKAIDLKAYGFGGSLSSKTTEKALTPIDLNAATGLLKEASGEDRHIVVIDEFENLPSMEDRQLFAELVKQLSDRKVPVTLVFCGIGSSLEDLLHGHGSSHRYIHEVRLPTPPLTFSGCWEIIDTAAGALNLTVNSDSRLRIAQVSDGFPHYVHLICEKLFWIAQRSPDLVEVLTPEHYMEAVKSALQNVEARLRMAYDAAVKKQLDEYQEVLWSVADHFELERNTQSIYTNSYERIMADRGRPPLTRSVFTTRLAALKSDAHGRILTSSRKGWVRFSENLIRGYVRLVAEANGVRLALEHEPGPAPKVLTVGRHRVGVDPSFPRRHYPMWKNR